MKEKVLSLAKGNFTYEPPELVLEPEKLEFDVVTGMKTTASFILKNRRGTRIKGFGSVNEPALNFLPVFNDSVNELQVEVDATELVPGEDLKGRLYLVTSCGEAVLPYSIHVVAPGFTDGEEIVDNYHKLCEKIQENPQQGVAIFHDPLFEEVFLYRDEPGRVLYHHLKDKNTRLQSMEEFLVATGKKKRIHFYVKHPASRQRERIEINYEMQGEDIQDSLQVRVNTWGSIGIQIRSDRDFIEPEVHQIWTDEFVGNTTVINFRILADRVPAGRRYGSLILESLYEKKEIRICVHNAGAQKERKVLHARKAAIALFVRTYLAWREGLIDEGEYQEMFEKNREVIQKLSGDYGLAMAGYIAVVLKDELEILNFYQMAERLETPQLGTDSRGVENYILILYVKYLYTGREEDRQQISRLLEAYMDNGYQSMMMFLISLHVDERYDVPERRAEAIRQQMKQHPCHVVLRSELLRTYQQEPGIITELDQDVLSAIYYGVRRKLIPEGTSLAVSYLTERISTWNPLVFAILTGLYEQYEQQDMLRSICGLLIRCEKREKKYFPWFARGVEEHLRLTELYEYYMYTMDFAAITVLPDSVLSYFQYENHLNDACKAFLYAYIVRNREEQPEIFRVYGTHIREYALEQLGRHRVTEHIAVIYEELFLEENIQDSVARDLPYVMFNHLLECHNERVESVVVVHAEMKDEMIYPLVNGQAVIQIFTPNYQLFFVDREGHYCARTIEFSLHEFLHMDKYALTCYEQGAEHVHLLAHLAVKAIRRPRLDDNYVAVLRRIEELGCFRDYMYSRLLMRLYDHYCERKEATLLAELLEIMPVEQIKRERLAEIAEACIRYSTHEEMYDKAEKILLRYGVRDCDSEALTLLVKYLIKKYNGGFVPVLIKWAVQLYREKCYDREVMNYLACYYMGSTHMLAGIYNKCYAVSEGVVEDGTKERLLGQVLFSDASPADHEKTFIEYYENGNNRVLVKAFLSQYAYEYVVGRVTLSEEIFTRIEKEAFYVKDMVMVLAALKYYSKGKIFAWKQQEFIERNLELLVSEGLVLTFMKNFIGKLTVPHEIENAMLIQYNSGTDKGVFLHIRTAGEDTVETEPMKKVFDGIYTKELLLFSDEEKICYIEEEETGKKTDEMHVSRRNIKTVVPGFFQMVNDMIVAKDNDDTEKYQSLRRQYEKKRAVAEKLFKLQ